MIVSEIMTTNPIKIGPRGTVAQAMSTMLNIHCHHLPVLSAHNHLVGLVSDYNCQRALNDTRFEHRAPNKFMLGNHIAINEVMIPAPTVVAPETSVIEAARLMFENNIRCLPVMRDETLVGIITTSDLLIAFINMNKIPDAHLL